MRSHSYPLGGEERKEEKGGKEDSLEVGVKVVSLVCREGIFEVC